jgi:hypothetical protein
MRWINSSIPLATAALVAAGSAAAGGVAWKGGQVLRAPESAHVLYTPAYGFHNGTEVVMVFVATSTCRASHEKGFPDVFERVKVAAGRRAAAEGKRFRVIGVALDSHPEVGLALLQRFGKFDELSVGGNWMNQDVVRFVWRDMPFRPSVPQVVLLEREIVKGKTSVRVSADRELRRLTGTEEIRRWGEAGAPFTGALPSPSTTQPSSRS